MGFVIHEQTRQQNFCRNFLISSPSGTFSPFFMPPIRHCADILLSPHGQRLSKRRRNYNPCPLWLVFQTASFRVRPAVCNPDAHPCRGPFPSETVSPLPRGPVATPRLFPVPLFLHPFYGVCPERRQRRPLCGADFHEHYR